jgi:peptidylprolyl isomerase
LKSSKRRLNVKFKHLLMGLGIAGILGAALFIFYNGPLAADVAPASPVIEEIALDEVTAEQPALDEAALEEMLAENAIAQMPAEVELDEAAMADFLNADMTTTASGLQYVIETEGAGAIPEAGAVVQVHYEGKLADGTIFDSSYERDEPIAFPLGQGLVIPGWDEGISLLSVGSKAKLIVPPELAYGEFGAVGIIPPNATLYFEVELVDILPGSPEAPVAVADSDFTTTGSGLKYYELAAGNGVTPEPGQLVAIHYTGWLEDGTKVDSSLDWGQPFIFPLGEQAVIPGWDEAVSTMKVGGQRQLVIPPELAFGEAGIDGLIPPNSTLIFEVELVDIQQS